MESNMPNTIGYHFVKSTYGICLPGDDRGHWSDAWDEQIGYIELHHLHEGDPIRRHMAEERMRHPPVRLTSAMITNVMDTIGECVLKSKGGLTIVAAAIEPTHFHLLIPFSGRDIDKPAKWIADQTTKAIHRETDYDGPVWGKGKWCSFVFDDKYWSNSRDYIERHHLRQGKSRQPYTCIAT